MEQRNMKQQRKKYAITSALLALVLVLTGTFAWTSISQGALNRASIQAVGGRIHDDYNRQALMAGTDNTANKDIYAENFGDLDLIVRIKLSEYLEIGGTALTGGLKTDKTTWEPYIIDNTEATRDYVDWTMGGDKIFLPTFNLDIDPLDPSQPLALATDATGDAIDDVKYALTGGATGTTALGDGSHAYFEPSGTVVTDPEDDSVTHTTKSTISHTIDVMSMQEWIDDSQPTGNFWVIDEEDGWAYWAELLAPGEATSLLLNEITFTNLAVTDLYYATHVIGEFATVEDIDQFSDASSNAQDLLDAIVA